MMTSSRAEALVTEGNATVPLVVRPNRTRHRVEVRRWSPVLEGKPILAVRSVPAGRVARLVLGAAAARAEHSPSTTRVACPLQARPTLEPPRYDYSVTPLLIVRKSPKATRQAMSWTATCPRAGALPTAIRDIT